MDDIVHEFLIESSENLDQLDRDLLALEDNPGSHELLSSIFRTIHTIKGTSGFLAFNRLESLTHTGESLLSRLRDGLQPMDTPTADALLLMVDTVRAILASIEATGGEGEVDIEPAAARLKAQMDRDASAAAEPAVAEPSAADEPAVSAADEPATSELPPAKLSAAESSLRVDVELLDKLMRLAGELVLTRNQLVRGIGIVADPALSHTAQRLNVITSEVQESIMKTRMQPIDHLWSKLPRVVRDLSAQCGRRVRLEMSGKETELDRTLLDAIKDPLTHLVRNAIDHGIEPPAERERAGKPAQGTLHLRAYHNSGQVVVEVADDGAGITPDRIAAKAVERKLCTAAELAEMSTADILQLIFQPGFSTAAAVTNVSGRGVGMDVVKTNIEAIGGTIEIESEVGAGTTCRLRVPLTLAIVPALTISCGAHCYAIPQVSLLELVAIDGAQAAAAVEHVAGAPVYRLRGDLLPLIDLAEVLGSGPTATSGSFVIAVLRAGPRRFGLLVEHVLNTEEIVVKPLSARLKNIGVYSGATILGDGTVALILDVQNLARRALRGEGAEPDRRRHGEVATAVEADTEPERLLIAGIGDDRQVAISMAMVTRLEMVAAQRVERVGGRDVVQYRGEVIPLLNLGQYLGAGSTATRSELPVAVYTRDERSIAMVVDEIVDIVEYNAAIHATDERGFIGSVVVKDRIIGLLDVEHAILAADPAFFTPAPKRSHSGPASETIRQHRRLLHSGNKS